MNKILGIIIILLSFWGGFITMQKTDSAKNTDTIYLAGGCFWGVEAYFGNLPGVVNTTVGYANGQIENPTYEQVSKGDTDFAETVMIKYNPQKISLQELLQNYFDIVDITSLNRQAHDIGTQYRSGIYYLNDNDRKIIEKALNEEQQKYEMPIVTEVKKLENFYPAEEYHQKYLKKNPHGYCHIDFSKIEAAKNYKKEGMK